MSSREIYLDNAATTWASPEVLRAIRDFQDRRLGNASSLHLAGVKAATLVEENRQAIADVIGAHSEEIIFTSGGTESNNLALRGFLEANKARGKHFIVSAIEHSSIINTAQWLSENGYRVSYAPVDAEGFVLLNELEKLITPDTSLISIVHANNEVGTIQDIRKISGLCRKHNVALHLDACQSFCKVPLDVRSIHIDLMTLSSHKIHGPTGIGALYIRDGVQVSPILFGGKQEKGIRSGTYNTEGIIGFGTAAKNFSSADVEKMKALRELCLEGLRQIPSVKLNGPAGENRLCNNINITLTNAVAKSVMFDLSKKNIYVSTGSACSSGKKNPSHVLLAMGRSGDEARECLRISFSRFTTSEDIDTFLSALKGLLHV